MQLYLIDGVLTLMTEEELDERIRKKRVIRGGHAKIKRVSTRKGYKIAGGKEVRMKQSERRKRARVQRKAARKRKAKKQISLRRTKLSVRKGKRFNKRFIN